MDNGFHERYRRRLGEELRISVKLLLGLLTEGDNCIDDNSPQLERFCLVVEKAFLHGLQDTIWGRTKHYWDFIQNIAKLHGPASHSIENVLGLSQVRTSSGRGRAWIRFALIEKKLEKYMRMLIADRADITAKWYEPYALFRVQEDYDIFVGFLAPLSMVDFSICLKDIDFDNLPTELGLYSVESLAPPAPTQTSDDPDPDPALPTPTATATDEQPTEAPARSQAGQEVEVVPRSKKDREREKEKRARQDEREKWQQLLEAREAEWKEKTTDMAAQLSALTEQVSVQVQTRAGEPQPRREGLVGERQEDGHRAELEELERRLRAQEKAGEQREDEVERLRRERLLLEADMGRLTEEVQARDARLGRLGDELAALGVAKEDLQRRLQRAEEDMTQREQQLLTGSEQERTRVAGLEAQLAACQAERDAAWEELQPAREALDSAAERLSQVEAELVQAREAARATTEEAGALRRECEQLRDDAKLREAELEREKADAAQRASRGADELRAANEAHEAAVAALQSTLSESRDRELRAEMEARSATEKLARAHDGAKARDAEVERLQEELKEARRDREKLARTLDGGRKERERESLGQEEGEGALKRELQEAGQRLEEAIRREEQLAEQVAQQQRRERDAREAFDHELAQQRKAHDEKVALLQNKAKVKGVLVDKKTRELEEAVRERDEAQAQLRDARQDAQTTDEARRATIDELQAALARAQGEREADARAAGERLIALQREKESVEGKLVEVRRRLDEELATLRRELGQKEDELRRQEAEASQTAADVAQARRQELDAALARASAAEAELAQARQEADAQRARREKAKLERDGLREEKQKKEKDMDGLMKLLLAKEARIEELQRDADEAVQRCRAIEADAQETAGRVADAAAADKESKRQLEELRTRNAALQQQSERDAAEIAELRASARSAQDHEETKALVTQMQRQLGELLSKAQRDKDELAQHRRAADEQRRAAAEAQERLRATEEECRAARLGADEQRAELEEMRRVLERKEEIIKESKQLINDRERRIREFMNKGNRELKASGSGATTSSNEDLWVVLDDKTQHRLLDDMRNVLEVTKQMVEDKAHEIDLLQEQMQAKAAQEQQMQATIDQLNDQLVRERETHQQQCTGLEAKVVMLAEQGAVLKRLLALHNDTAGSSSRSAPASPLSRPK